MIDSSREIGELLLLAARRAPFERFNESVRSTPYLGEAAKSDKGPMEFSRPCCG